MASYYNVFILGLINRQTALGLKSAFGTHSKKSDHFSRSRVCFTHCLILILYVAENLLIRNFSTDAIFIFGEFFLLSYIILQVRALLFKVINLVSLQTRCEAKNVKSEHVSKGQALMVLCWGGDKAIYMQNLSMKK